MEYQLTLNWPDFLERHWQKRPVVLKRGFNNFIDPISPDELEKDWRERGGKEKREGKK